MSIFRSLLVYRVRAHDAVVQDYKNGVRKSIVLESVLRLLVRIVGAGSPWEILLKMTIRLKRTDMREFDSGATRDDLNEKLNYEAFLSPAVLEFYAQYMHEHRKQSDGSLRAGDNWQKGIPLETYRESLARHYHQAWGTWRGNKVYDDKGELVDLKKALCGVLFNTMGQLHELLKEKKDGVETNPMGQWPE